MIAKNSNQLKTQVLIKESTHKSVYDMLNGIEAKERAAKVREILTLYVHFNAIGFFEREPERVQIKNIQQVVKESAESQGQEAITMGKYPLDSAFFIDDEND